MSSTIHSASGTGHEMAWPPVATSIQNRMREFRDGLAEVLEVSVEKVAPDLLLAEAAWDSLAVVSTIALIDDVFGLRVDGQALNRCETVADLMGLVEKSNPAG